MAALKSMNWLRRGFPIAPLCLSGVCFLSGCVATKKDVRTLQQQLAQMNAANQANQDSIRRATARELRVLQDSIRASTELMRTMRGQLTNDIRTLQQLLEQLQNLFAQNEQRIAQLRDALDRVETAATQPQRSGTQSGGQSGGQTPEQLYTLGQEKLTDSPATAELLFRQIVNDFPQHSLAPDAMLYIGQALANQERWDDAIAAWEDMVAKYPTAIRAPQALLLAGNTAENQSKTGSQAKRTANRTKARQLYNRIVQEYATSGEATLARRHLANLPR